MDATEIKSETTATELPYDGESGGISMENHDLTQLGYKPELERR